MSQKQQPPELSPRERLEYLKGEAEKRGFTIPELQRKILGVVEREKMISAVLDDEEEYADHQPVRQAGRRPKVRQAGKGGA